MSLALHAPAFAWLAALAVPLVVVYFLKLRRERMEVSSLALWRQVMADQRVNAPFQRFRRNLLLLLQLLALLLLVGAATLPSTGGAASIAARLPILVDCSASMGALDRAGGVTRLEEVKRRLRERISVLPSGEELCLVAFAREPRRLTGFTDNRRELARALDELAVEDLPADPAAALQLASAMRRVEPFERVELISDGNLPEAIDAELSFKLDYQRVAPGGANLGIVSCDAQRRRDGDWDVFVAVAASGLAEGGATLHLSNAGGEISARPIAPAAGRRERVVFRVPGGEPQELQARLDCDGFDALAADDRAWLALPATRPLRAYVAKALPAWRRAAQAQAAMSMLDVAPAEGCDLIISDREDDLRCPAAVRLGIAAIPPELAAMVQVGEGSSTVVEARRGEPALSYVSFTDLIVAEKVASAPGALEQDFEALGWEVVVHGDQGPLMLRRGRGGQVDYRMLFHSDRSTLPYRIGLPILVGNLVDLARQAIGQREVAGVATGYLPALAATAGAEATVTAPDGSSTTVRADADGQVTGVAAPRAGIYRLRAPGVEHAVGVGLLSEAETSLASAERLAVREVPVAAATGTAPGEHSWWELLAAAAFAVALVEWWMSHRPPKGRLA